MQELYAPDASTALRSFTKNVQQKLAEIITTPQFFSELQESAREDSLCFHAIIYRKDHLRAALAKQELG